jgi:hypothetical protein
MACFAMLLRHADVSQFVLYFRNQSQCGKNKALCGWLAAFDKRVLQRFGSRVGQVLYSCCLLHVASFPIMEDLFGGLTGHRRPVSGQRKGS